MLADDIRSMAGGEADRRFLGGYASLSDAVVRSERFILGPDAMAAACQAVASKPSSILAAVPLCRPPFREAWLEWEGAIPGDPRKGEPPARVGFLLECLAVDHRQFRATMVWKPNRREWARGGRGEPLPMVALTSMICDFSGAADPLRLYVGPLASAFRRDLDPAAHGAGRMSAPEAKAYRDLIACTALVPNALGLTMLRAGRLTIHDVCSQDGNPYADGDAASLLAALCLLNCATGVAVEPADIGDGLRRARAKAGKAELLGHSIVRMALSRRDRAAAGVPASALRQHLVRGHFKLRRGGLHWWRPFLRGDAAAGIVKHVKYTV